MSDYAPTEEDFIRVYGVDGIGVENQANINRARRGIAKLKADALREAAEESEQITCEGHGGDDWFPSERVGQVAVWLDVRADRIEDAK